MNDFNCGSGPSPISERLTLFNEIVRLSKKKEEKAIVEDFTYQNVRVVELVAVLNYIIALYNFGLPVDNLYSIIEAYEQVKEKSGSCYFYILEFIENRFKSIHPVLLMLDRYTKSIYKLLKDEGQMIGKFQFYVMAKAIASYQVATQDVIDYLAKCLNQCNKELSNKARFSSSSITTLISNKNIENTNFVEITEKIEMENKYHNRISNSSSNSSIRTRRNTSIKEESNDDDTLIDNTETNENSNSSTPIPAADKMNTTSVKMELPINEENDIFNINIEKKSMIYECITSLNVYSKFHNIKFDIPFYPSDELIEKIENL
ncbi:hypothetical protein BCR36DRAFT_579604 [Piromyces finnis]|uniref:Uncharacterized protein n=1 Tax=Piromyces finnis TaxID=1754191 RepID=A0A1Y1VMK4_9FUNG|nr:hypothetical protein BCR36DRAFT_579604 [Piromyces finnis]|eukprot:ORX60156.1 hypothetical protein BCR36DRAFT_579604 [Piromyces finnis]